MKRLTAIFQALLAAALFGASAPLSKLLLGETQPVALAALLYLGCGLGLLLLIVGRRLLGREPREAALQRSDLPWLAGALLSGGVAAPILLLYSLRITPGATASLLLNFEAVATTLLAALLFGESIGRRVWAPIALVTLGGLLLSWDPSGGWGFSLGALGVLAACALWGLDNNLIGRIAAKDPMTIVMWKGLGAGSFSLLLAWLLGQSLPGGIGLLWALLLGSLSYGLSIVLFVQAMRSLGVARTSVLFSTAPLAGVLLSVGLLGEVPGALALLALALMSVGVYLLAGEAHVHLHEHDSLAHDHRHTHTDEHHAHNHAAPAAAAIVGEHAHAHSHEPLAHEHAHDPDLHHRHED